jgi:hypothetical protein
MEKSRIRNTVEVIKDEMIMRERILAELSKDPQTILGLASILNKPAAEVMFWVMAMWRYGVLEEQGKPDSEGYCKYQPVNKGVA